MFRRMNRAVGRNERGSALIAVVGVMAVLVIITLTVTSSSLQALNVTMSIRAGVQAQAAAEAGIDVTLAALQQTTVCRDFDTFKSPAGELPVYVAEWTQECSTGAVSTVHIVSTGHAGFDSAGLKSTRVVESIFSVTSETIDDPVVTSYGDFLCDQGCSIVGEVRALGNVTVSNHAKITGGVHTNGSIAAKHNGEIEGSQTHTNEALPSNFKYDPTKFNAFSVQDQLECSISREFLEDLTVPTVLDLRACDKVSLSGLTAKLQTDVAFILPADTNLVDTTVTSDGSRRVWFLTPTDTNGSDGDGDGDSDGDSDDDSDDEDEDEDDDDDDDDGKKKDDECGAVFGMTNVTFSKTISVMISTPCEITLKKTILSGQLFGGQITVIGRNGADKPEFPVTYAGVNMPDTESNDPSSGDSPTEWTLTSSRDLTRAE